VYSWRGGLGQWRGELHFAGAIATALEMYGKR